jgi:transcription elongation factor GreA
MINLTGLEPKTYRITPEGIAELQRQLDDLLQRRRAAAEEIREISSQSTDAGSRVDSTFAQNRNEASELDAQIALCERIISLAEPIEQPSDNNEVRLGSEVTLRWDGQQRSYRLVGSVEADPLEGRISDESPLGKSLIGKRVEDSLEVSAPDGEKHQAQVVSIV